MKRKIISIKGLAELTNTHRTRIYDYLREGRIRAEFVDDSDHRYWSITTAKKIAQVLEEERASHRPGPGRKLELKRLRRRRKARKQEVNPQ